VICPELTFADDHQINSITLADYFRSGSEFLKLDINIVIFWVNSYFQAYLFFAWLPENKQKADRPSIIASYELKSEHCHMYDWWIGCPISEKLLALEIFETNENSFWSDNDGNQIFWPGVEKSV
jgi:hypothetical protein